MKTFHDIENKVITFLDERFYLQNGIYYPSVTTVLDVMPKGYGFQEWLKSVGQNAEIILKKAGDEGSNVHDAIDKFLKGNEIKWADEEKVYYNLREWNMILRFKKFYDIYKPNILSHEESIVSEKMKVGGTMDLVWELDGVRWLTDHKTGNGIYNSHFVQISTYATMWNERYPDKKIDKCGVLWLNAKTKGEATGKIQGAGWQLKESPFDIDTGMIYYNSARKLWDLENPNAKPKNKELVDRIKLETL